MLYNKAVMWIIILEMPYFVLFAPIVDYFSFQWIYFVLKNFYAPGSNAASDIGLFLMFMMLCTFFYFQLLVTPWLMSARYHGCGPIPNGERGWGPARKYIADHHIFNSLW